MTNEEFAQAVVDELGQGRYVLKPNHIIFDHDDFAGLGFFPEHMELNQESVKKTAESIKAQWVKRQRDIAHARVESPDEVLHGEDISKEEHETEKPKKKKAKKTKKAK